MVKRSTAVRRAKRPVHRRGTRAVAVVGLAALALLAGGLSAYALFGDRGASDGAASSAPTVPSPTESVAPTPVVTAETAPTEAPNVPAPQRLLAAGGAAGNLVRATIGSCDADPGVLEVTFNGGEFWQPAAFGDVAVTEIHQIDMSDAAALQLVALDETCSPLTLSSFVGGTNWASSEQTAPMTLAEVPASAVDTATGRFALPCTAVSLSVSGARGIALCEDASVTMTRDSGATWSAVTPVSGAVAVGATSNGFVIASADEDGCDGVRVRPVSADTVGEPGGCLTDVDPDEGTVAVAGEASSLFVWAGDRFAVSSDGGATWS